MPEPLSFLVANKYLWFALVGAAIKTLADYKAKKCTKALLAVDIMINTVVAVTVAVILSQVMMEYYPDKHYLIIASSFFSGLVGINITMAVASIKWKPLIQSRLEAWAGKK